MTEDTIKSDYRVNADHPESEASKIIADLFARAEALNLPMRKVFQDVKEDRQILDLWRSKCNPEYLVRWLKMLEGKSIPKPGESTLAKLGSAAFVKAGYPRSTISMRWKDGDPAGVERYKKIHHLLKSYEN